MPRGIHDVTVTVPTYGSRRVTIIYPATSDGNNTPMTSGIKPVIMAGHGQIGNGSFSSNGEGIGFAGSSYLLRSMTTLNYVIIAPHFTDVVNQMTEGTAVARFFLDYAFDTWANGSQLDENAIGYTGTSMGGMIGYALMNSGPTLNEPRIKAYYFRATSRLGSTGGTLLSGPALLHAHGTSDNTVSNASGHTAFDAADQPKAFITLPGIGHDLIVTGPYYTNDATPAASGLAGFFGYFLNDQADGLEVLSDAVDAVTTPNTASIAEDWGTIDPPPPPPPPPGTGTAGHFGTHLILEPAATAHTPTASLTGYNNSRQQIINCMNVGCFVAFGLRIGWDNVETGRVKTAGGAALNSATITVDNNHPAIASGTVLKFATLATIQSPVSVTTSGAHAANATTLTVVASHAAIPAGARAGLYDDRVLDASYNDTVALGYKWNPRFMNGKYTPLNLISDGSPLHAITAGTSNLASINGGNLAAFNNGGVYHEPYNSAGVTNPIVLLAITQFYEHIFAYADTKTAGTIPIIMAGTLPGMDYAELWYAGSGSQGGGDYPAQLHGASDTTNQTRFVTSNSDLMDRLVAKSAGRYPIGFGISGVGNLFTTIAPGIAAHAVTFGEYNNLVFVNANGWSPTGEWGSTAESTFDANVWSKHVQRGVQDISPTAPRTAANWVSMFGTHCAGLQTRGACWAEIYAYQVRTGGSGGGSIILGGLGSADVAGYNEMVNQANLFNATFVDEEKTVTLPLYSMPVTPTAPGFHSNLIAPPLFSMPVNVFALTVTRSATMPLFSRPVTPIAPLIAENKAVTVPLFDMPVTPIAPSFGATLVSPPLFNMAVNPIQPAVARSMEMPLHSQSVTPIAPVVARGGLVVLPLHSMPVTPLAPSSIKFNVTAPLFSMAVTPVAPTLGRAVTTPLFSMATTPIAPSNVRLSVTAPLHDMALTPIGPAFSQPSVSVPPVQPPVFNMAVTPIAPTFSRSVPNIIHKQGRYLPTISKEGRYLGPGPRRTLKGRYLPTTHKRGRFLED